MGKDGGWATALIAGLSGAGWKPRKLPFPQALLWLERGTLLDLKTATASQGLSVVLSSAIGG